MARITPRGVACGPLSSVRLCVFPSSVTTIAPGTSLFDHEYQDCIGDIATCFFDTTEVLAVVDPGPASTFPDFRTASRLGATLTDVRVVLVTHIPLYQAGHRPPHTDP